jgi:transcriptional regulator with XRE-family HTH domain
MGMATLRDLRVKKVWAQEDLARESGVSTAAISRLERGERLPRFVTIRKLAKALGVEASEIEFRKSSPVINMGPRGIPTKTTPRP